MPVTWVAWAMVPSTPARIRYFRRQASPACSARAAVRAWWIWRWRKPSWRPERTAVVHRARAGQGWQVALANRAMMMLVPLLRAWGPGAGYLAFGAGDLPGLPVDGEHVRGVPAGAGLRGGIGQQRGEQRDAAGAGGQQQLGAGIPAVGGVLAGPQAAPGQRSVHALGHPPRRSPGPGWSRYW